MKLNPYLFFNGQCEAAFKFYEQCLAGQIVAMMTHANTPNADQASADWGDKILHARLIVGDTVLMGSDSPAEYYEKPQGFCVSLLVDTAEEAERVFSALSENGTIQMPIEETFWAIRFGMFIDQFGTPWMVNCERPMA